VVLTQYGLSLMISVTPPLLGVLAELRHVALRNFHARLLDDPLAPARTRFERRHLRRRCAECALLAQLVVTRRAPRHDVGDSPTFMGQNP
jgi:hypothetical protein